MYEKYWGLKEKPFQNTPDPRFLYYSAQHKDALLKLDYAVKERMGAAMLTGVFGCGKTVLAQALLEELTPEKHKLAFITHPQMDHIELLMSIASNLGDKRLPQKKTELLANVVIDSIREILLNNFRDGKETVIIIDEAHILDDPKVFEELRLLLNLQLKDRFLLTLLIIGQPELALKIDNLKQLEQRIAIKCHLRSLDREDSERYILHRLKIAGRGEPIFTKSAIDLIYECTGGIPRRINRLCDLSLLSGYIEKAGMIDEPIVRSQAEGLGVVEVTRAKEERMPIPTETLLAKEILAEEKGEEGPPAAPVARFDEEDSKELYQTLQLLAETVLNRAEKREQINIENITSAIKRIAKKITSADKTLLRLTSQVYKGTWLYRHSANVSILAMTVGLGAGIKGEELIDLGICGLLHDIGMVKVPASARKKKEEPGREEDPEAKRRPVVGAEILNTIVGLNKEVVDVVSQHEEREDRSGYPRGRKAKEILLKAKIIGLVDTYEKLVQTHTYKKRLLPFQALRKIVELEREGWFASDLAKSLIAKIGMYPIGSWVKLNTEEIGEIVDISVESSLLRPVVRVAFDREKKRLDEVRLINLVDHPAIHIKEAIDEAELGI